MRTPWWDAVRFALPGVLLLAAAYAVSETVDPVRPEVRQQLTLLRERRDTVRAVAVGNSHARAIDFAALDVPGVLLWRSAGDVFETAYLAREAVREAPELRYVLVSVAYPSLRLDNAVLDRGDLMTRRREMYTASRSLRWIAGDADHYFAGKMAPIARPDHWYGVVRRLLGDPVRYPPMDRDGRVSEPEPPLLSADSLTRHAARRVAYHAGFVEQASGIDPRLPARTAAELDDLARALGERGIWAVFYTPPYFHAYTEAYDREEIEELRGVMAALERRHEKAVWLDFSADSAFAFRPEYFLDSDHLNPAGARAFSTRLGECLRALPERVPGCGRREGGGDAREGPRKEG